MRLQGLLKQL